MSTVKVEKIKDIGITAAGDFIASVGAWYLFYFLRYELDFFGEALRSQPPSVLIPAFVIGFFWIGCYATFGLYRELYLQSRFDELVNVFKISAMGTLILFFILFLDGLGWNTSNLETVKHKTLVYGLTHVFSVSVSRLIIRTIQKARVLRGIGLHNTLLVGTGPSALHVMENLRRNAMMGMKVVGFIKPAVNSIIEPEIENHILGELSEITYITDRENIDDVIVAFEPEDRHKLVQVLDQTDRPDINVKILPDFYQVISGMNKTNQIFGLPLIDVLPDPMPSWEKVAKRLLDVSVSAIVLVVGAPLWILVAFLVKITSPGPMIFAQKRVGLFGREFVMYKFRTMYQDAEKRTGPVWATDNDPRITPFGWWMRKLRLDEIPQLLNVFKGDMSLVGPRPERQFFVEQFKKEIPLYTRRLRVKPGITGWAQVKWKYDTSLDDVKEKTKYDLFYIENMSLRMDFKILINTILTVITAKGK